MIEGNINEQTLEKYKVGDIIYPHYNGTSGFFKRPRWDVVTRVDKEGNVMDASYLYTYASVRALEIMFEIEKVKKW